MIPQYISAEAYAKASGLGIAEVKKLCKKGEIPCKMTEGGHYKIPIYEDSMPREEYEKVKAENIRLRTILNTMLQTIQNNMEKSDLK